MLKTFFKVTLRSLWRNKGFSVINIAGLAIGMASTLLICLWIQHEMSYDRFHANTNRIYQLYSRADFNGKPDVWPRVSSLMAAELKKDYAEVEDAVRFRTVYFLLTKEETHLNVEGGFADSGFLSVFSFPLLKGNAKTALNSNKGIVLTQGLAKSLFGEADPMGQTVRIDSMEQFTVTGVLKDLPDNTEFTFRYLLPSSYLTRLGWEQDASWKNTQSITYVLLKPGASQTAFDNKIQHIVQRHVSEKDLRDREVITQPLKRAHLYARADNGKLTGGRIAGIRLFSVIAVFILLIACINFMNLSTARSAQRAREVGVRKVVGARKGSLIAQFMGESLFLSVISFLLALVLVTFSLDAFNRIIGVPLHIEYTNPGFWLLATAFILFTGLLAGSYPAFFLSSYKPASVLKGVFKNTHALVSPRKALVILQFTFAIILIICTIIVERQVRYARDRQTGYNRDQLIYTFVQGDVMQHYELIKHDLISSGAALSVTRTYSPMIRSWGTVTGFSWPGSTDADGKFNFAQFEADADFTHTTGAQLLAGRDIDLTTYPTDSSAVLLNEAAVKTMRLKDPIGTIIRNKAGMDLHVIGVVKDFIIESPYDPIEPMIIGGLSSTYPVVHIRLNPLNTAAVNLEKAGHVFKTYNPQYPFEYYFIDEFYDRKFKAEQREGTLGMLFAGLTILISCLGLFGLATYMAETRTREIGIRKVLGASVAGIATLLSKDFIGLVLIAVCIASPIAWFAMHAWLQGFSYRIDIGIWVFLMSGLLAILIALATISYQAIRAGMANPVKNLRSE